MTRTGSACGKYAFVHWPPRPDHPEARFPRKCANSDKFAFPERWTLARAACAESIAHTKDDCARRTQLGDNPRLRGYDRPEQAVRARRCVHPCRLSVGSNAERSDAR